MKALLTTGALIALLSVPALAQSEPTPPMDQPPAATEPAPAPAIEPTAPAATEQPALPDAAAPDTATAPTTTEQPMFVNEQATEEKLASNWIGQTLYNTAEEDIGSVDDLLLTKDGEIKAVIVGVGGFLGLGKKNVAITLAAIDPRTDENGNLTLVGDTTADALKAAPEFKSLADAQAEMQAAQPPPAMEPPPATQ
jgi:hypothetical protein